MKVLVTGGAGFIGSHVVERLLERGDRVVCLDNFNDYYDPARKRRNVAPVLDHPRYRLAEGDVRDEARVEALFREEGIEAVIHIAAMAGVRYSIRHPDLYYDVNVRGTLVLLEAARRHGVRRFLFASSSSVYAGARTVPFREEDPADRPISPYAATKRAAELLCHTYHHLDGLEVAVLRFFTVYGPRGRPDMAPYLFTERIARGEPIQMFGDGSSRRDYTYIDDIVAGVLAALDLPDLGYEIFNLGNSETVSLREFIATVEAVVGRRAIVEPLPPQPGDMPLTYADISRARRRLGYAPQVKLREGLERFWAWYRREVLGEG